MTTQKPTVVMIQSHGFSDQKRCFLQVYTWSSSCEGHFTTRNHNFFDLNFGQENPPYGFFAPCPI